mgnify:FL=1
MLDTMSEMDAAILKAQLWQQERRNAHTPASVVSASVSLLGHGEVEDRPETDVDADNVAELGPDAALREYPPLPPPLLPQGTSAAQVLAQRRLLDLLDAGGASVDEGEGTNDGLSSSSVELLIKETEAQQRSANAAFLQSSPPAGTNTDAGTDDAALTDLQRLQLQLMREMAVLDGSQEPGGGNVAQLHQYTSDIDSFLSNHNSHE